jgi:hypothetical protein
VHKGIGPDRQETSEGSGVTSGSRSIDDPVCAPARTGKAGCESSSSASVTSLAARRRLDTFNMFLLSARTTYSWPILTIEYFFMRVSQRPLPNRIRGSVADSSVKKTTAGWVVYRALTGTRSEARLKHDPAPQGRVSAKGTPIFPRDKSEAFARRTQSRIKTAASCRRGSPGIRA